MALARILQAVLTAAIGLVTIAAGPAALAQPHPPQPFEKLERMVPGPAQRPAVVPPREAQPQRGPAPLITTGSPLPPAAQGESYKVPLEATGGRPPYAFSLETGRLPAGLSLKNGAITGTPTETGSTFRLRVTDSRKFTSVKDFSLMVRPGQLPPPPKLTSPATLPQAVVGKSYHYALTVTGGVPPVVMKPLNPLPAGLALNQGVISGTPKNVGTAGFRVLATDAAKRTDEGKYQLTVAPSLAITTGALPMATVGEPYQQDIATSGGMPPATMQVVGGQLPPGLTLTNRTISGSASTKGTWSFQVKATDAVQGMATKNFSIVVAEPPTITSPAQLPLGTTGLFYQYEFKAAGGSPPYTFALAAGQLPPGLPFASVRAIMGAPTSLGTFSFTIRVTDNMQKTADKAFTLSVYAPPHLVNPMTLPSALVGKPYQYALTVTGGAPPVTIEVLNPLPAGLTLNQGVISGTPTTAGTTKLNMRVTDAATLVGTATYALTVIPMLAIATDALPTAYVGAPYQQSVSTSGGTPPSTLQIVSGQLPPGLVLANNLITGSASTAGTWTFQVKATDAAQDVATKTLSVTAEKSATVMVLVSPLSAVGFNKPPMDYAHVTKTVAIPIPLSAQGFNPSPQNYQTVKKLVPISQPLSAVGFAKSSQP